MAVLPFIVFSTQYNYLRIFEIKVDDSSSALRFFLETPQLKRTLRHSEKQEKFEMTIKVSELEVICLVVLLL